MADRNTTRRKKSLIVPSVLAAVCLFGAASASASAAETAPATAKSGSVSASASCKAPAFWGTSKENLALRKAPRLSSTSQRLVYKNTKMCIGPETNGGQYTKCGKTSKYWTKVTYRGTTGYVVSECLG
ncbi:MULTISPECIES: SH3 domain-containing protein [unclassified Streptomyces]|uniref:SH3 domain-containing protein n=1 Tax=unclassified Streptomyces TaxID=2593676 RepID=UPI002DDBE697|nr:SH3 domain-containing protein [Streptomyces sp. NBC_01775]WSB77985.1 SH3 domain-containing protein [Streptomyces sp. NBC_01775]WSS42584.1 SH3 domain-containing protein [Streptomyces sp. NBC_01187]